MKRFVVIILLLFAGAVVALPGAVGLVTERQHDQIVRQINGPGDRLTEEHYERGWFSTRTRYRYRIEDEQMRSLVATVTNEPRGIPELLVTSEIFHGPVPVLAGGSGRQVLAWTDMDSTLVLRSPLGVEITLPGELKSRVEPNGSSRFRYRANADTRSLREGLALSWDATDIDVVLGRNGDTVSVAAKIGLLELSDADAALRVGPAVVTATQQRSRNGLWTGESLVRIDGVSLPGFAADDLLLETQVAESSGQATYALELKADNLQGQGLTGKSARIDFFAQRLDAGAVGSLLRLLRQYPDPARIPAGQRDALLSRLLATGPEVTLRTLKIPMPDADFEGDAFVSIDPGTGIELRDLGRGAQGNATLLVPKEMVNRIKAGATQQTQAVIELMMGLRVLKPEGNRYRIEAAYAGGLLTVNGFPIPVPNL